MKLQLYAISVLTLDIVINVRTSDVFHVNSKITFYPDGVSEYFGYSVLLSDTGFHIGAPKAKNRYTKITTGLMFTCPLDNLDISNVTCHPMDLGRKLAKYADLNETDMWFGANMVESPDNKLWVCAPRIIRKYKVNNNTHLLANGACYALDTKVNNITPHYPLHNASLQSYAPNITRQEYDVYGSPFNYYAYGQSGFSLALTKDNHIVLGAPGVMQNAGTLVDYKFVSTNSTWKSGISSNPFFTKELKPDDYFGYSVDSGVFDMNGTVLYVAGAPRSEEGYGQVLIFKPIDSKKKESEPLNIKAKLRGPQLGGYFGAVLCTLDLNGDGVSDLLVGAPNFATRSADALTYDEGAVFVYITRGRDTGFLLEDRGSVQGSGGSGARFGSAIADLGDLDGNGYADVAIGSPWENDGRGVVYIYRGSELGLSPHHYQRIYSEGARGFGVSISKGYDLDKNNCSDLAIGAYNSGTAYIYRGVPTIHVMSAIRVPEIPSQEAANFTALFCITVPPNERWHDVEIPLRATVTVDAKGNRAFLQRDTDLIIIARPNLDKCENLTIGINNQSDLSRPIELKINLKPDKEIDEMSTYPVKKARLSDTSILDSSLLVQLVKDCGEDLICTPWLEMSMEFYVIEMAYVPGTHLIPGINIRVMNLEEPAYSVKLHVVLPCPPIRMDERCSLENLNLTCDLPSPLNRNETAEYDFRLGYVWDGSATEMKIVANFEDSLYKRNVSDGAKDLIIPIVPISECIWKGKSSTKSTVIVARETLDRNGDILFTHSYEITNEGPSDIYNMTIEFLLPEGVILMGNSSIEDNILRMPPLMLKAHASTAYHLPMRLNMTHYGKLLEGNNMRNVTTAVNYFVQHGSGGTPEKGTIGITSSFGLEPLIPAWHLLVGPIAGLVAGLLVLAVIMLVLRKFGFFSRQKKEELKKLLEDQAPTPPGSSSGLPPDGSTI